VTTSRTCLSQDSNTASASKVPIIVQGSASEIGGAFSKQVCLKGQKDDCLDGSVCGWMIARVWRMQELVSVCLAEFLGKYLK